MKTPDVTLIPLKTAHAADLFAIIDRNRAHFRTFLSWVDGCTQVEQVTQSIAASREQGAYRYGIDYQGRLVGTIAYHGTDVDTQSDSVGYWLDADHQGKGIMTQATRLLLAIGYKELGLNLVRIRCATANLASRAIPERLGFQLEGVIRQSQYLNGRRVDMVHYSLLASEYQAWTPAQRGE